MGAAAEQLAPRELAGEADPIGALLAGDYDRTLARPRWCSQQAARCIRERADAVLYLVNAAELPSDAEALAAWAEQPDSLPSAIRHHYPFRDAVHTRPRTARR